MSLGLLSLKWPAALFVLGLVVTAVAGANSEAGYPFFVVAFLWLLLTGRSRRSYWAARLRSRAAHDERMSRRRSA